MMRATISGRPGGAQWRIHQPPSLRENGRAWKDGRGSLVIPLLAERAPSEGPRSTAAPRPPWAPLQERNSKQACKFIGWACDARSSRISSERRGGFSRFCEHPRSRVVGEESKRRMSERQECGRVGSPLVAGQAPHRGPWTCAQYMARSAKA